MNKAARLTEGGQRAISGIGIQLLFQMTAIARQLNFAFRRDGPIVIIGAAGSVVALEAES
jgi:hypothetical protein